MLAAHPLSIFALNPAVIAEIAAAVGLAIGVDDLAIKSNARHTEPIIVTHNLRRVHNKNNNFSLALFAHERDDTVIGVVKIDPLKACVTVVLVP